ncbi:PACE efflux transporter [Serratia ureilytica]|uniref:PACE efflux transporter n=1 Tax=Serratia ureilytica TaxID=300181 RepID=UPI001F11EAF7|nr:PACE efflux transporter [Serratia ureilytica]
MLMLILNAGSSPATTPHSNLAIVRGFLHFSPSQRTTHTAPPLTGCVYGCWLNSFNCGTPNKKKTLHSNSLLRSLIIVVYNARPFFLRNIKLGKMKIELNKSRRERVFHAVLFELLANVLTACFVAFALQVPLIQSALLSVTSALTATSWNYIFNKFFDEFQNRYGFERSFMVRVAHAVTFEVGLIVLLTPMAMILLGLPLVQAFVVEIGLVLFFLPYTIIFNWCYDYARWILVTKREPTS